MRPTLYQIEFAAHTDAGTGYTADAQNAWLAGATRRVINCLTSGLTARCPTQHANYGQDEPCKLLIETTLTEEQVRERIGAELGRKSAYVTVRPYRGTDLPECTVHPNQPRAFRGVLCEAAEAARK